MPNTSLPTNVTAGTTNHTADHNVIAAEINRLSRDTGWRDVSSFLKDGWALNAGGKAQVRRQDNQVTWRLVQINGLAATSQNFFAMNASAEISNGFGPDFPLVSPMFRPAPEDTSPFWFYVTSSQFAIRTSGTSVTQLGISVIEVSYKTDRAWPTFLPPAAV